MLGRVYDEQNTARGKQVRHDFSSRGATNRIASPLRSARPARPKPAGAPDHGMVLDTILDSALSTPALSRATMAKYQVPLPRPSTM